MSTWSPDDDYANADWPKRTADKLEDLVPDTEDQRDDEE